MIGKKKKRITKMNNNIEPGCLSVVTNSGIPENVGKVVGIVKRTPVPDRFLFFHGEDVFWKSILK